MTKKMETRGSDICYGCGKVQEYQTMSDVTEDGFDIYCDTCLPIAKKKLEDNLDITK